MVNKNQKKTKVAEMDTSITFRQIPVDVIGMENTIGDGPEFRASVQRNVDELEEIVSCLDSIDKGGRECVEQAHRVRETISRTVPHVRRLSELEILEFTPPAIKTLISLVEIVTVLEGLLITELVGLVGPLLQEIRKEVALVREARKTVEKGRDRLDTAAARFSSIPKQRDPAEVREDAHSLLECKKTNQAATVTLAEQIIRAKNISDFKIASQIRISIEKILKTVTLVQETMTLASEPTATYSLKTNSDNERQNLYIQNEKFLGHNIVEQYQIRTVLDTSPFRPVLGNFDSVNEKKLAPFVKIANSVYMNNPKDPNEAVQIEGYLFFRKQKGLSTIWRRIYLSLYSIGSHSEQPESEQDGNEKGYILIQKTLSAKKRGYVEEAFSINVLLCEARPYHGADRRFCLEINTSSKSLLYQAECEEELRTWLLAFDKAKSQMLNSPKIITAPNHQNVSDSTLKSSPDINYNANILCEKTKYDPVKNQKLDISAQRKADGDESRRNDNPNIKSWIKAISPSILSQSLIIPLTLLEDAENATVERFLIAFEKLQFSKKILPHQSTRNDSNFSPPETLILNTPCVWRNILKENSQLLGRLLITDQGACLFSMLYTTLKEISFTWSQVENVSWEDCGILRLTLFPKNTENLYLTNVDHSNVQKSPNKRPEHENLIFRIQLISEEHLRTSDLISALIKNSRLDTPKIGLELIEAIGNGELANEGISSSSYSPPDSQFVSKSYGKKFPGEKTPGANDGPLQNLNQIEPILKKNCDVLKSSIITEEAHCKCKVHLENSEIDIVLPIDVDSLFEILMGCDSAVFADMNKKRGHTKVKIDSWKLVEGGESEAIEERRISFVVPVNNPLVKAKETDCFGLDRLFQKDPGNAYVVIEEARTPNVPYGDTFVTESQFCMTRVGLDGKNTRLRTHSGIRWLKSTLVKPIIKSTIAKSKAEYMRMYAKSVREHISRTGRISKDEFPPLRDKLASLKIESPNEDTTPCAVTVEKKRDEKDFSFEIKHSIAVVTFLILMIFLGYRSLLIPNHLSKPSELEKLNFLPEYIESMKKSSPFTFNRILQGTDKLLLNRLENTQATYKLMRVQLDTLIAFLIKAECRLQVAQYACWLADQLAACYANLTLSRDVCAKYETEWRRALSLPNKC